MTTHDKDKIIALRNEADKFATEKLLCEGEYHPDFHTVSDEYFYAIAFESGAASRDAEIARLKTIPMKYRRMAFNAQLQDEVAKLENERNQLREQVKLLRDAIEFVNNRIGFSSIETYRQWEDIVEKALAATEQVVCPNTDQ